MTRGRRAVAPVVIVVVVVAVLVVASVGALFATGVLRIGGGGSGPPTYAVFFNETGLVGSGVWTVTLGGNTQSSSYSSIQFNLANGTYSWTTAAAGYAADPQAGLLLVQGPGASQDISFLHAATYAVTFNETGLPSGTSWIVRLANSSQTSSAPSIVFSEPNGSYAFTVSASGYAAGPSSGTVYVTGEPTARYVHFTAGPATYDVTFSETGLGSGASWIVVFNGTSQTSSDSTIQFSGSRNGTYSYSVSAPTYNATPSSGSVTIAGTNPTVQIAFTSSGGPGTAVTYSEADATAAAAAASYYGSGWTTIAAAALAIPRAYSYPTSELNFSSLCPGRWIGTQPPTVTFPATAATAPVGTSAVWFIFFSQSSNSSFLAGDVINGIPNLLYLGSGGQCTDLSLVSAAGSIDSSQAVTVANANGGSAFLASHSGTSTELALVGGAAAFHLAPTWDVTYTTCRIDQTSGTGQDFNATINGTSGQLISTSSGSVSCTQGPVTGPAATSAPILAGNRTVGPSARPAALVAVVRRA